MHAWIFAAVSALAEPAPAPELKVGEWITPGPVAEADDPLLVVEIWATWCGPCKGTFPKLSALQEKYGERIRVVALTDESPAVARRFYQANRQAMGFAVAATSEEAVQAWLFGGFEGRGIPSVYVVAPGDGELLDQVVWSGAPAGLEAALAERLD